MKKSLTLIQRLSEETGLPVGMVYKDVLKIEETLFDKYLFDTKGRGNFHNITFFYSAIGYVRKTYRENKEANK